jgi:sodium transport system permease protein
MLERVWIVFQKEFMDNSRDRRAIGGTLLGAILGPAIILLLIILLGQAFFREAAEVPLELPVAGAENAPALVEFLKQQNITILPAPPDPEAAVRNGDASIVLVIPPGYAEDFAAGRPASVQLVLDNSRQSATLNINRAQSALSRYSSQIGFLRLYVRGIDPAITTPLAIETIDVATPQSQVLIFLNTLPYFLLFTIFSGGAGVIIDVTAGERERNSLEPLLINPVRRWEFVVGKLLSSLPFAGFTLLVSLSAFAIIFNVVPLEEFIGIRLSIDVSTLIGIFFLCLPMIFLASSLQAIIATFARNFKEAQTYVGFLPMIPALPGLGLAFLPVKPELWTMLIPTFGQQILINQLMRGEPISLLNVAVSVGATLVLTVILVVIAIKLYEGERPLFGRS